MLHPTTLTLCALTSFSAQAAELPRDFAVPVAGAKADGVSDDTAALQHSLDAAARAGGRVQLPPGRYLVKGSLHLPPNVTSAGVMDSPVGSARLEGSVLLAIGGPGQEVPVSILRARQVEDG